jgi:hypothetical protein
MSTVSRVGPGNIEDKPAWSTLEGSSKGIQEPPERASPNQSWDNLNRKKIQY